MLDKQVFSEWLTVLSERFRQPLSSPTSVAYYAAFRTKLSTEQFVAAATALFEGDADRLPSPPEIIALARNLCPEPLLSPAPLPKAYAEMSEPERMEFDAARKRAEAIVGSLVQSSAKSKVFSSIGQLAQSALATPRPLTEELAEKRAWLGDRVMRREALEWAMHHPQVAPITNDEGEVIDLEETNLEDF